ncbi:hypothetical protein BANRA_00003 [Klebsiella pneumoniae]|nr:hypothetical protein BANRA_00003 [Klebsiella pneumoniae]
MGLAAIMRSKTLQQSVLSDLLLWIDNNLDKKLTVDDLWLFPGICFGSSVIILTVRQWNISASSACRCVAVC